jgi:hypothetical protein
MSQVSGFFKGGDVEPIRTRICHYDRAAWTIFATSIAGMVGILGISLVFGGRGASLAELKAESLLRGPAKGHS